jgi:uncharacterized protein (DUF362 family)
MARTQLPVTTIIRAGATQPSVVYADITNNHSILNNDGRIFVEMANVSNASNVNVTIDVAKFFDGDLTVVDLIVALAPAGVKYSGPFKTGVFNQNDDSVNIDVSSTGVSFRAYKLSP